MIHRRILRQCGGDLEYSVKSRTTEQYSEEDIINIFEEVTTRTKIVSSRVKLKTRFNTPWKDSVHKNPKENSNNKYKSSDTVRKCHICQNTTHLANTCPKRGKSMKLILKRNLMLKKMILTNDGIKFNSASNPMKALRIFDTNIIFPHIDGNLRITVEFVVMENFSSTHFILGNDYLIIDRIDFHNNKDRYFTIGDKKLQKFAFLPFKRQITVNKVSPINLELEKFTSEQLREAEISLHLTDKQ
ncbi:hypothetical protein O181_056989 [Austropuccinia psidii MF-1]|uniref:Uncharacterized protein n=1 Tax=Austropuccinia psidii MF-1 TaxID=1389203 RepID=A0A9Q3E9J5_9BASI|nr:hypothetical protein [Austropuccinia psidii MF-1]